MFGIVTLAVAIALNIGWVVVNWRTGLMLVFGVLFFALLIAGVALNTIFLIREIKRNEQHDAFINSVTHELKTPIASMRLYLQTLKSREPDTVKRQQFYDIMLADSDRLMATVEQVLQAGRTGAAAKLAHKTRVDIATLVRETGQLAQLRHRLGNDAIRYHGPEHAYVEGDAAELKTAVANLLDNAIKYSAGSVQVRCQVTIDGEGRVGVQVKDEGVGIPPQELKHVFKRFYRIPGSITQRVKGTGLGLFIVNSIAKRHGGRVYAESEGSGRGSTFTIQLPGMRP